MQGRMVMVKYSCHNCNDLLLKSISSVLDHVWAEHKIEVAKMWQQVTKSEDAHLPPRNTGKQKISGFQCGDCKVSMKDIPSFLAHLDKMHGIHIWYERGLTRKRVYFDGILDSTAKGKTEQQKLLSVSKKNIPLSKLPYEPRKSNSD